VTTASVLYKVRRILRDTGEQFSSQVAGDGVVSRFELPQDTIDPATVSVTIGPTDGSSIPAPLGTPANYTLDGENGIITLTAPLVEGQLLTVTGIFYETFIDNDIIDYIQWNFIEFTQGRNPQPMLDPIVGRYPPSILLSPLEERALSLAAARDVMRDLASASASEFTIDTGDGTVIPQSQQYQQFMNQADVLDGQYQTLAARLGIQSADTINVSTLRRISASTNRLVPLYVPREYDDRAYPQRILPPINTDIGQEGAVVTYRGQWNVFTVYNGGAQWVDEVYWLSARYLALAPSEGQNPADDVANGPDGINGQYWQVTYLNSGQMGYGGGW
jgi:hypothetical protein